jgi:hypothetical protein
LPINLLRRSGAASQQTHYLQGGLYEETKLSERLSVQAIVEAFNLFDVTNIRGVNNVNFSGFRNTLIRDSEDPASPGFLRSSQFGAPLVTAGGVFGTGGPRSFQFAARVHF